MPHGENLDIILPKVQEPRNTWFSEPARVCAPATNSTTTHHRLVDAPTLRISQPLLDRAPATGAL